jgi:heme exporter protein C
VTERADAVHAVSRRAAVATMVLGILSILSVAATVWLGLWVTPPDVVQGDLVRLVYLHPPVAWVGELAFGVTAVACLLYLWPRTRHRFFDHLAGASAEIAVVFTALTLLTGSIWGRPAWGVWWTWDARLTTTAVLLVLGLGYLALRRVPGERDIRAKRAAVAGIVAALDVPLVHFSVLWWRTLHQPPTVLGPGLNPTIHGSMAWTLLLGFCSFTLVYAWLLVHRVRSVAAEEAREDVGLSEALEERRAEVSELARQPDDEGLVHQGALSSSHDYSAKGAAKQADAPVVPL